MNKYNRDQFLEFATLQQHEQFIIEIFKDINNPSLTVEQFKMFYNFKCIQYSVYNDITWFNLPNESE